MQKTKWFEARGGGKGGKAYQRRCHEGGRTERTTWNFFHNLLANLTACRIQAILNNLHETNSKLKWSTGTKLLTHPTRRRTNGRMHRLQPSYAEPKIACIDQGWRNSHAQLHTSVARPLTPVAPLSRRMHRLGETPRPLVTACISHQRSRNGVATLAACIDQGRQHLQFRAVGTGMGKQRRKTSHWTHDRMHRSGSQLRCVPCGAFKVTDPYARRIPGVPLTGHRGEKYGRWSVSTLIRLEFRVVDTGTGKQQREKKNSVEP